MSQFGILLDAETIQCEQQCAISNLNLLQDLFEREITALERSKTIVSTDYLQELAYALCCVSTALQRANEKLKAAVEEESQKRKKA